MKTQVKPSKKCISHRIWSSMALVLGMAFLIPNLVQAAPWILELADTPETLSETQVSELEAKARAGDWQLKMEFAAAYLYEQLFPTTLYGCQSLKYGHRCRAMAKRIDAGRIFLREVIDTEPKNHVDKVDIRKFQEEYAFSLRPPAFVLETGSEICRDKVHYYEQALKNGSLCAGNDLEAMARYGTCMKKSEEQARIYQHQIVGVGCPK